ncbi:MAG: nitrogenase cofactor biosynthesis protein NifB [Lachnospiraceae bacterium]|jgi:nitrogenase cofactor biosynthesis protein NifB|nr:nitrogenase cofactor biosynthesis protein NifB [Lachnospiraceae bacterium]
MAQNFVNLNVNPCKMCMPMGAVTAFYGLRGAMTILHGSQGCATYIRRHMATHFNEPVDIASSSLTEEGTVFGGEKNLLKGIDNLIKLYNPEVIGVCTTCLAETIGEDTGAIVKKYLEAHPECTAKIITVPSPGYGGTQNEGFFRSLRAIVEQGCGGVGAKAYAGETVVPGAVVRPLVNIVMPQVSPADTRWMKGFLENMGVDAILLPDLSENLDGETAAVYERLRTGGTPFARVADMAGAALTIEFSHFVDPEDSPGEFLKERFGVPVIRLALPCGVRGMEEFVNALVSAGAKPFGELKKERGRYLDAMVDGHKYCCKARAAVFGEPDFVEAMVRLCCENGIVPVLAATGSVCKSLGERVEGEMAACGEVYLEDNMQVMDDADFTQIELACASLGVNLMIGNSDGRRVARGLGLPLIRCAFPIHDHVGGQRTRMLGYEGSLTILDQVANAMIDKTHGSYRKEISERFLGGWDGGAGAGDTATGRVSDDGGIMAFGGALATGAAPAGATAAAGSVVPANNRGAGSALSMDAGLSGTAATGQKRSLHPCFDAHACHNARLHLPIAPKCNIQCNYCLRKYDCANESRPGVTSGVLSPDQAIGRFLVAKEKLPNLTVVGIAGPGEALANFDETRKTLQMIREADPDILFCLSTNGLMLPLYAKELAALGVSHVTVTVNAVDPEIGAKIYKHIEYMGATYTGKEAAAILMANQLAGIRMVVEAGIACKVNCVAIRGVNDGHIDEVAKMAKALGAQMTNIMPHIPVAGSAFGHLERLGAADIDRLRDLCEAHIPQMRHCRQCRADAAGTLGNDVSAMLTKEAEATSLAAAAGTSAKDAMGAPVATSTGAGAAVRPAAGTLAGETSGAAVAASIGAGGLVQSAPGTLAGKTPGAAVATSKGAGGLVQIGRASAPDGDPRPGGWKRFAAATKSGTIVDMHFGHANEFYIYDCDGADVRFVDKRRVPQYCTGGDGAQSDESSQDKWAPVLEAVGDCCCVLSMRMGYAPQKRLEDEGIGSFATYDPVEKAVREAYAYVESGGAAQGIAGRAVAV